MPVNSEVLSVLLQFGFAGVLLAVVYLVNKQFIKLVDVLGAHLGELVSLLQKCMDCEKTEQ